MVNVNEILSILSNGLNINDSSQCQALVLLIADSVINKSINKNISTTILNSLTQALEQWNSNCNCDYNHQDITPTQFFGNSTLFGDS